MADGCGKKSAIHALPSKEREGWEPIRIISKLCIGCLPKFWNISFLGVHVIWCFKWCCTYRDQRGHGRRAWWKDNQTASMDSDQSGSPVGTASQHIDFVMVFDCFWWLCTWGVIFGSPKEATQALRSRCLSSLDKASISPPCQTGGFRDSQSKPSSSRLGTPNFSSWSSCNGVVELPNICNSILSLWLKNIITILALYWSSWIYPV